MSETQTKNKYTSTFVLDTRGYEEPVETIIDKLREILSSIDCDVITVKNLGQLDFARITERNYAAAIYVRIDFDGPSESVSNINEKLRLDKRINRVLIKLRN